MNLFVSFQHFLAEICVNVSGSNILDISKSLFLRLILNYEATRTKIFYFNLVLQ